MDNKVILLVIGVFLLFAAAFFGTSSSIIDPAAKTGAVFGFAVAGGLTFIASAMSSRKDDK